MRNRWDGDAAVDRQHPEVYSGLEGRAAVIQAAAQAVTWIKVPRPTFDLVGVLVSSLSLTGILAAIAFTLGAGFGIALIRRRRRRPDDWKLSLHLDS